MATCLSHQAIAQEENKPEKSFSSFKIGVQEGDGLQNKRFFFSTNFGFPVTENGWFGLNFSYDKVSTITDYNFLGSPIYTDVTLLGVGGFYRLRHPISDKFSLSNDILVNVFFNTDNDDAPKPLQLGFTFEAEYNPKPNLGLRVSLGQLAFTKIEEDTFINLDYLFSIPSMSLLFYF